jgi:hypothetical protein
MEKCLRDNSRMINIGTEYFTTKSGKYLESG